jgi:hypothetical protein
MTYLIYFLVKVKWLVDLIKVTELVSIHSEGWDTAALGIVSRGLMRYGVERLATLTEIWTTLNNDGLADVAVSNKSL